MLINSNIPPSSLSSLKSDLRNRCAVTVKNVNRVTKSQGIEYGLIIVQACCCLAEEFINIFGNEFAILAREAFSNESEIHDFGVLVDQEKMVMLFAFNMLFAEYNCKTCRIEYKDPQIIILEAFNKKKLPTIPQRTSPTTSDMAIIKYGIVGDDYELDWSRRNHLDDINAVLDKKEG